MCPGAVPCKFTVDAILLVLTTMGTEQVVVAMAMTLAGSLGVLNVRLLLQSARAVVSEGNPALAHGQHSILHMEQDWPSLSIAC